MPKVALRFGTIDLSANSRWSKAWLTASAQPKQTSVPTTVGWRSSNASLPSGEAGRPPETATGDSVSAWREPDKDDAPAEGGPMKRVPATEGDRIDHAALGPSSGDGGQGLWRVELLLQATDDPSLVVGAEEVWRRVPLSAGRHEPWKCRTKYCWPNSAGLVPATRSCHWRYVSRRRPGSRSTSPARTSS